MNVLAIARKYAESRGLSFSETPSRIVKNVDRARLAGRLYEAAKHRPNAPAVARSYAAFKREVLAQYDHALAHGIKVSIDPRPYSEYDFTNLIPEFHAAGGHLTYQPTRSEDLPPDHPLSEISPHGIPYNDLFRVVHDIYGHIAHGHTFTHENETRAWAEHAQLFSPEARPALTNETFSQNSWLHYGPHRPDLLPAKDRPYATQKATLPPKNAVPDVKLSRPISDEAAIFHNAPWYALRDSLIDQGSPLGQYVTEDSKIHKTKGDHSSPVWSDGTWSGIPINTVAAHDEGAGRLTVKTPDGGHFGPTVRFRRREIPDAPILTHGGIPRYHQTAYVPIQTVIRWSRPNPNGGWTHLHVPLTHDQLHDYIDILPTKLQAKWRDWAKRIGFQRTASETPVRNAGDAPDDGGLKAMQDRIAGRTAAPAQPPPTVVSNDPNVIGRPTPGTVRAIPGPSQYAPPVSGGIVAKGGYVSSAPLPSRSMVPKPNAGYAPPAKPDPTPFRIMGRDVAQPNVSTMPPSTPRSSGYSTRPTAPGSIVPSPGNGYAKPVAGSSNVITPQPRDTRPFKLARGTARQHAEAHVDRLLPRLGGMTREQGINYLTDRFRNLRETQKTFVPEGSFADKVEGTKFRVSDPVSPVVKRNNLPDTYAAPRKPPVPAPRPSFGPTPPAPRIVKPAAAPVTALPPRPNPQKTLSPQTRREGYERSMNAWRSENPKAPLSPATKTVRSGGLLNPGRTKTTYTLDTPAAVDQYVADASKPRSTWRNWLKGHFTSQIGLGPQHLARTPGLASALPAAQSTQQGRKAEIAAQIFREAGFPIRSSPAVFTSPTGSSPAFVHIVEHDNDPEGVRYAAAWNSMLSGDPATVFHVDPSGSDSLHILQSSAKPHQLSAQLRLRGVQKFTLETRPTGSRAYILNPDERAARNLGVIPNARRSLLRGTVNPVSGSQSTPAECRAIARKIISDYESSE